MRAPRRPPTRKELAGCFVKGCNCWRRPGKHSASSVRGVGARRDFLTMSRALVFPTWMDADYARGAVPDRVIRSPGSVPWVIHDVTVDLMRSMED